MSTFTSDDGSFNIVLDGSNATIVGLNEMLLALYKNFTPPATNSLTFPGQITYQTNTYNVLSVDMSGQTQGKNIRIDTLTFDENIQNIAPYSFSGCNINTIVFPSTIQTIGDHAFNQTYTTYISFADLGQDSTCQLSIGTYAFANNHTNLYIAIPSNTISISAYAFYNCNNSYVIFHCDYNPNFSASCFNNSSLAITAITTNSESGWGTNPNTSAFTNQSVIVAQISDENFIFTLDASNHATIVALNKPFLDLYSPSIRPPVNSLVFPGSITYQSVQYNVTKIDTSGLNTALNFNVTNITFSEGIQTITTNSFSRSWITKTICFPTTLISIGAYAFSYCNTIAIFNGNYNPNFDTTCFSNSSTILLAKAGLNWDSNINVFVNQKVTIMKPLFEVNYCDGSFNSDGSFNFIVDTNNNATIVSLNPWLFDLYIDINFPTNSLTIPGNITYQSTTYNVTDINTTAQTQGDSSLIMNNITFSEGIQNIASYSFAFVTINESIVLPSTLKYIGVSAFEGTNSPSITFSSQTNNLIIRENAFNSCQLTSIELPSHVVAIGSEAFYSNNSLASVTFDGAYNSDISSTAFESGLALTSINAPANNGWPSTLGSIPVILYGVTSNTCFPAGTLITTNQGPVPIESIDPAVHTIRGKKIVGIVTTLSQDDSLVLFRKDALSKNVPTQDTMISRNHCVFYKANMIPATHFTKLIKSGVEYVPRKKEVLYNVLMEKHDKMCVNNLIVETLHPDHVVARLYREVTMANEIPESAKVVFMKKARQILRKTL